MDITDTLKAKSDQLNADDLIGGPITVQVEGVRRVSDDQPLAIAISGGHMPFRPCKSMRRLIAAAWGVDARAWAGRWLTLYRDDSVKWGGVEVGGVRISHMSHLDEPVMHLKLSATRGKKASYEVRRLDAPTNAGTPTAKLEDLLADEGLTEADVDAWRASNGKGPVAELTSPQRAQFAAWLASNPGRVAEIRGPADDGHWAGEE